MTATDKKSSALGVENFITTLLIVLTAVSMLAALTNAWMNYSAQHERRQQRLAMSATAARLGEMRMLQKQIQIDVIQVQQFLTDVSATRGLNGLDDGWGEAAKNADAFRRDVAQGHAVAKALGAAAVEQALQQCDQAFGPYYEVGQTMAHGYVRKGPAVGNKLMPEFDAASDNMTKAVEASKGAVDALAAQTDAANTRIDVALTAREDSSLFLLLAAGLVTSIGGAAVVVMVRAKFKAANQAEANNRRALQSLADQFESNVAEVVKVIGNSARGLEATAGDLSSTSARTTRLSESVASAAEQASSNVTIVASSTDQIDRSVSEIAQQMNRSTQVTSKALERARITSETMAGLSASAVQIGNVITVISQIAEQTNLLALNATIESARAGEAGRGFAVVASEVKSLANQTSSATENIREQIGAMQASTDAAVLAISEIQTLVEDVSAVALAISAAVEEQSYAAREIAISTREAAVGVEHVAREIGSVSHGARDAGASSERVVLAAGDLGAQADRLNSEMVKFLKTVRAA